MELNLIVAIAFGLLVVYVLFRIMARPIGLALFLCYRSAMGLIILLMFNVFASRIDLQLPVNPVTALLTGVLGLPGIALSVFLVYFWS